MAIDTTKMLMLGGLAVLGFVVYRKFNTHAAATEVNNAIADMTPADVKETYDAAATSWQQRITPTRDSHGNLLFEPLDISDKNPLSGFVAVLKEMDRSLNQLASESGRPSGIFLSSDKPNDGHHIARLFFFNPSTGREVPAFKLKASDLWLPDMQPAVENTFMHAFNAACKVNPRYNQWDNTYNTTWKDSAIPYQVQQCDIRYPVNM